MKNPFLISEEEKNRILTLHENSTKKQYLKENITEPEMTEGELDEIDWGQVGSSSAAGAAGGAAFLGVGAIPGAIIGGAANIIYQLVSGSPSKDGAERILQACKKKSEVGAPTMGSSTLNAIADGINAAIEGLGTDEEAIKSNLMKLKTIPDLCAMASKYKTRHGESLFAAIDGDIDSTSEWKKYVYLPLLDLYEKSQALGKQKQSQLDKLKKENEILKPKAAKCGWIIKKSDGSTVPDVEGYRKSGWKCPKDGASTQTTTPKSTTPKSKQGLAKTNQPTNSDFDKFLNA